MTSITNLGFVRVELDVSVDGPYKADNVSKLQRELIEFFKERELNISGKIKYIRVDTLEIEKSNAKLDTGSSSNTSSGTSTS